jgi:DNA gyrase/topoisomerase IV subunit A
MVIMNNNYIKKMNVNEMVPPSQMGRVNLVLIADNSEDMVLFSSLGKAFKVPVHKIPLSEPSSDGTDVRVLNKYCTTNIIGAARETTLKHLSENNPKDKKNKNFIFTVTNQGYIKKIDIEDVVNAPTSGIIYARVDDGDHVNSVLFGPSKMDIMLYSNNKVIRLNPKEVPYLRRATKGNRVSTANTIISGMNFILPKTTDMIVVTKKGYVNRIPLEHIGRVPRGRAGISVIKLTKGDSIHTIWTCPPEAKLVVREGRSQKEFPISGIKSGSTVDTGKKMFADVNKVMIMC